MKELFLSLFTLPFIFLIIYTCGALASRPKTKLKLFSIALFVSLVCSFPIIGKFMELPLTSFSEKIKNNNLSEIKSIVVLTGGIYQNSIGEWMPSKNTEDRITLAKKVFIKKKYAYNHIWWLYKKQCS